MAEKIGRWIVGLPSGVSLDLVRKWLGRDDVNEEAIVYGYPSDGSVKIHVGINPAPGVPTQITNIVKVKLTGSYFNMGHEEIVKKGG